MRHGTEARGAYLGDAKDLGQGQEANTARGNPMAIPDVPEMKRRVLAS